MLIRPSTRQRSYIEMLARPAVQAAFGERIREIRPDDLWLTERGEVVARWSHGRPWVPRLDDLYELVEAATGNSWLMANGRVVTWCGIQDNVMDIVSRTPHEAWLRYYLYLKAVPVEKQQVVLEDRHETCQTELSDRLVRASGTGQ